MVYLTWDYQDLASILFLHTLIILNNPAIKYNFSLKNYNLASKEYFINYLIRKLKVISSKEILAKINYFRLRLVKKLNWIVVKVSIVIASGDSGRLFAVVLEFLGEVNIGFGGIISGLMEVELILKCLYCIILVHDF